MWFKDPVSKKKEKQKKRKSTRLQRSSAKVIRSSHILTPFQQRVVEIKTRGKKLSYSHRYAMVIHHVLTHYSVKAGIKKFGVAGTIAVSDELQQLYTKDTFTPVETTTLSPEQKKSALRSLMFVKKKRDGKIKGRACADGRKQRDLYAKEDTSSPTVSIEAVLLTSVIDAQENRDVAVTDITGAYLTTDIDEEVHMILEGKLAEMLVLTALEVYRTYITTSANGKPTLYVKLKKVLYGCLRSALLFLKKLSGGMVKDGFVLNPYDACVANKEINGSQCTIIWHVDDLKISHNDPKVVDSVLT